MNKKNKYITVLDFEHGSVFRYEVGICDYQEYLSSKGHNLSNCEWMIHAIAGIINNNDGSYGKL